MNIIMGKEISERFEVLIHEKENYVTKRSYNLNLFSNHSFITFP